MRAHACVRVHVCKYLYIYTVYTIVSFLFKGGAVVDIFSAQGNDPVAKWKLYGDQKAISKVSANFSNV